MTPNKDKSQLYFWTNQGYLYLFDLATQTWLTPIPNPTSLTSAPSLTLKAVLDPESGIIYIPCGYNGVGSLAWAMMAFDPIAKTAIPVSMPANMPAKVTAYSWEYNANRKSMLLHGGRTITTYTPNPNTWEFFPANQTWTMLVKGKKNNYKRNGGKI